MNRPGKELELVLDKDVSRSAPVIRVCYLVLYVIEDRQNTIDAVGVENVIDEHLQVSSIVLLSFEIDPVVELNRGIRQSV